MSRTSKVSRIYDKVQNLIYDFVKQGLQPTTQQLQQMIYGDVFNPDSRTQRETIYKCIMLGRDKAIDLWNAYLEENTFLQDIVYIDTYEPETIKKELGSDDFHEFYWEYQNKRFGEDTEIIAKSLDIYPATAVLFNRKMALFSEQGHSFLISSCGNKASWYIPTWWIWNIRDFELYRRTLRILMNQFKRGQQTKLLLPSAIPIEKLLEQTKTIEKMLE